MPVLWSWDIFRNFYARINKPNVEIVYQSLYKRHMLTDISHMEILDETPTFSEANNQEKDGYMLDDFYL